jgi:hypothetical protein
MSLLLHLKIHQLHMTRETRSKKLFILYFMPSCPSKHTTTDLCSLCPCTTTSPLQKPKPLDSTYMFFFAPQNSKHISHVRETPEYQFAYTDTEHFSQTYLQDVYVHYQAHHASDI